MHNHRLLFLDRHFLTDQACQRNRAALCGGERAYHDRHVALLEAEMDRLNREEQRRRNRAGEFFVVTPNLEMVPC